MKSEILDDFTDVSAWTAVASGQAALEISAEVSEAQPAMRLDYDFHGGGGFVVARRTFSRPMPESYVLSFVLRGVAPANRFELKLADASGRNVWWRHWDSLALPATAERIRIPSREIEFAWGPAGGGALAELGAVEIAFAAPPGGAGTVWIADLRLEDRTYRATPSLRASSAEPGWEPERVLSTETGQAWVATAQDDTPWLEIDFREERELGGLVVTWAPGARPRSFRLEGGSDGSTWKLLHAAADVPARSYLFLPGAATRFLRFTLDRRSGSACGIAAVAVQPFEFSRSLNSFFEHVARDQPRGWHPRWLAGEQSYWTCAGLADGETCAILNEEGLVEVDRGTWSLEPFLQADGRLVTWADAATEVSLADGWIPVPTVAWRAEDLELHVTACGVRCRDVASLLLRYRVENRAEGSIRARLYLALRPFQVNPPWQAFGALGGTAKVETLSWDGQALRVGGDRVVVPLDPVAAFGAAAFEHGEITSFLAHGELPRRDEVSDAFGHASAALAFDLVLAPGEGRDVHLAVPFGTGADASVFAAVDGADALAAALDDWRARFGAVTLALPEAGQAAGLVARTATAQVLVNRDGPALQPGPRRYTRSWIRDGAVMAAALLRLGRSREAVEFVRWYSQFQREDGAVPCCVDRNGPDWLVEHDSHGELVFAIAECYRFTRARDFLEEMWPAARRAIAHLDALRATRLGPEYDAAELRARRGLLPESASHEGYLAHPVHSYWDDFWALQAYRDGADMAAVLGAGAEAAAIAAAGAELRQALQQSLERVIAERGLDYVPGSVEWADFDPTATAVAVSLLGGLVALPRAPLERGFDEYLAGLRRRRRGEIDWNNYSAYEVRIVGALVHLGRRADAAELTEFLLCDRRPRAWNQWPEISWRDPRSPGHLGDVPHSWIGAEYTLAFRSMLAYERQSDRALVVGAGVPAAWLDGGPVEVAGVPTYYGGLDLRLCRAAAGALEVVLGGSVEVPPGGIVVQPPLAAGLSAVEIDGRSAAVEAHDHVVVRHCPARIVLRA